MAGSEVYEFAGLRLNVPERLLSRGDNGIAVAPKSFDLLVALVRKAGRLAAKRELLDMVWPGTFVEEGILSVHISAIRKALGDEGDRRYIETVSRAGYRFIADVKRLADDESAVERQSIAVLPARPLIGELFSERDRHTGLAIADALIDRLGRCPKMVLRPARAVRDYVNASDDPAAIGRSLRVDAVLDTRFVPVSCGIQVSVHLIRSLDGAALWIGNFEEPAAGVMAVAELVANRVMERFGHEPRQSATPHNGIRTAADSKVYELIGRGRYHLLSYSMFEAPKAVEAFRAAIELDSSYAPAHAGLALACCAQAAMRIAPPAQAYNDARVAALNALAMDDSCVDAQVALGAVSFFSEWNWAGAEKCLCRALQLNPNHPEAFLLYGQLLDALGRLDEGLEMKRRALERDPFSPLVHLQLSLTYWNQRRYDAAIEWANRTLALDPLHPHAREHLAGAYWKKGDPDRYMAENVKHAELHGAPAEIVARLKHAYGADGVAGVFKLGIEFAAINPQAVPDMQLSLMHGGIGNLDKAFEYLSRAIDRHDPGLVHLAVGPQWDCLRGDPRFDDALARMGLRSAAYRSGVGG